MNNKIKHVSQIASALVLIFVFLLFWGVKDGECRRKKKRRVSQKDESMIIIAEGLYRDGFYDAAVTQLKKFLKDFPRSKKAEKAKFLIGEAFYFQKEYKKAKAEYNAFIQSYPESDFIDNTWFRLADCAYNTDDLETAAKNYTRIINNFPNSILLSDAYYWAGECFYQSKNYEKAILFFETFLEKFPDNSLAPEIIDRLGRSSFFIDDRPNVIKHFRNLLDRFPTSELLRSDLPKLGDAYYKDRQFLKAGEIFEITISDFPEEDNSPYLTFYAGVSFFKAGVYPCAIIYFEDSIPRLEHAKTKLVEDNVKLASEPMKSRVLKLLKSSPDKGIDYFLNSKHFFSSDSEKREELKIQLSSIQNNIENAFSYCGNIHFRMGEFNKAVSSYQQLISRYSDSSLLPGGLYNTGLSFLELNKSNEALLYFRKLIKKFPKNSFSIDAYLRSGVIYMKNKDYESAITMFKKALKSENLEINAEVNYYLGESYFKRNNLKRALKSYENVISMKEAKLSLINLASYRVAEIYLKQENIDAAQNVYQKLLKKVKSSELKKLVRMRIMDIRNFKRKK